MKRRVLAASLVACCVLSPGVASAQVLDVTPGAEGGASVSRPSDPFTVPPDLLRRIPSGGAIQAVWDTAPPDAGRIEYRRPDETIMRLRTREGMVTTIIFRGDTIGGHVLADDTNFQTRRGKLPNVLHLYPVAPGYDASLVVETTGGQVHYFYIRSETYDSPNTKVYVGAPAVRFVSYDTAPPSPGSSSPGSSSLDAGDQDLERDANGIPYWTRSATFDPEQLRHDLEFSGDMEIGPVSAFRDDKFTWLYWGEDNDGATWPVVWKVEDGIDKPVRVRRTRDARYLIVETTGPITLRRGEKTLCLRPLG